MADPSEEMVRRVALVLADELGVPTEYRGDLTNVITDTRADLIETARAVLAAIHNDQ